MMPAGRNLSGGAAFELATRTHTGRVRVRNEDVVLVDPGGRWAVLADGMGGYRGGEVAARIGVDTIARRLSAGCEPDPDPEGIREILRSAVEQANERIWIEGCTNPELLGMGSTVVAVVFTGGLVVCAHVGDSRLYRLSGGVLEQLTTDHTVVQEQIDEGLMTPGGARHAPMRSMLTRGLGVMDVVVPDIGVHAVRAGDVVLLCSDGLTDMLEDEEIGSQLASSAGVDLIAGKLIDSANARGGRDNVSVVVARMLT